MLGHPLECALMILLLVVILAGLRRLTGAPMSDAEELVFEEEYPRILSL